MRSPRCGWGRGCLGLGPRPHPPRNVYQAYLAQSQVFVGIYWQSYGWVAPGEQMSGLEDEYRLSAGMPRLIYVKSPAPDREPRLAEMLDRIQHKRDVSYQRSSDPDELQSLVTAAIAAGLGLKTSGGPLIADVKAYLRPRRLVLL